MAHKPLWLRLHERRRVVRLLVHLWKYERRDAPPPDARDRRYGRHAGDLAAWDDTAGNDGMPARLDLRIRLAVFDRKHTLGSLLSPLIDALTDALLPDGVTARADGVNLVV